MTYGRARCFPEIREWLRPLYLESTETSLSKVNHAFIRAICSYLGIRTPLTHSKDYHPREGRFERILSICQNAGATEVLCGPRVAAYMDGDRMKKAGVDIQYMNYDAYPEYGQWFPPFVHQVSIVDLLFHEGKDATKYMLSFGRGA